MHVLIALAVLLLQAPAPEPLHCRIELAAGGKARECKVRLPAGRHLRPCADADRAAGHCDQAAGNGKYVAWVVGTGPGRCRIRAKHTDWVRTVAARLSKSPGAPSTCDLYIELR